MSSVRCPICQQPFDPTHSPALPFCSARCREIDLRRWLNEDYGLQIERGDGSGDDPARGSEPDDD
jgi:endogenous inhibitor of DNA gyrase (YacG/DUF329 family)